MPWDDNEHYYGERGRNTSSSGRYSTAERNPYRIGPSMKNADGRGERSRYEGRSRFNDPDSYGSRSDRSYGRESAERSAYSRSYSERSVARQSTSDSGRGTSRYSSYGRQNDSRNAYSSGMQRTSQRTYNTAPRAEAPIRSSRGAYDGRGGAANQGYASQRRTAPVQGRQTPNAVRRAPAHNTNVSRQSGSLAAFWYKFCWVFQRINADVRGRRKHQLLPALYLPLTCLYSELLLNLLNGLGLAGFFYKILFGLSAGMLLGGFALLFKGRAQKIVVRVELFLVALLFIVECLVRKEFQVYFPLRTIVSNVNGVVGDFSGELFSSILHGVPIILLFFLPLILYWIMTARNRRRSFVVRVRRIFAFELLLFSFLAWALGMLTLAIGGDSGSYKSSFEMTSSSDTLGLLTGFRLNEKYALFGDDSAESFDDLAVFAAGTLEPTAAPEPAENTENAQDAEDEQQTQQVAPAATQIAYGDNIMGLDFAALNAGETDEDISAINTYLSTLSASKQNEYTGLFEGKNLILICAEALSDACIDPQLTPTLYRLMHNGFYFSQAYQPTWGGSTSSGEYSFLTGLVPTNAADTMKDIAYNNNYFTMGSQLNRLGYTSICYHNGSYTYYDRNITHMNLGYDQFIAQGNGLEDIAGKYPSDEEMISKTLDTYINRQPFSVYYMTCDGHKPYDNANDSRVTEHLQQVLSRYGDRYQQNTMNYICYQLELEDAMATLVAKLEAAGIADDTVICICSDHYPYGLDRNGSNCIPDLYGYDPQHPWERDRNAIIIWSGSLENSDKDMTCEISAPVYSLDLVPTLSNLFGVEFDSRLLVGRDVFSDEPAFVLWNDGSWVTERGRYDADEKVYYPTTSMADDNAYVAQMSAIVKYKRSYSKLVKNADYFQYIVDHLPEQSIAAPAMESTPETAPLPGDSLA